VADGTSFEIDIGVNAGGVEAAAAAVTRLGDKLTAAGKASLEATQAVKDGEAAYKAAESTALRATQAVAKIGIQAAAAQGKLAKALDAGDSKAATKAYKELGRLADRHTAATKAANAANDALAAEAATLDKLSEAAKGAADAEGDLKKSLESSKAAAKQAELADAAARGTGKANEAAEAFGALGGPLGRVGQMAFGASDAMGKLKNSMGAAGPYIAVAIAAAAVAAGVLAVAAAAVKATISIAKWAVGLADAARSNRLLSDGIAGSVKGGRELDAAVASVGKQVPIAAEELRGMAADLAKTGLKGDQLATALESAAIKASRLKWGPDFAKQMLSLDSQAARLKANFSSLFAGLKIDKLLEGLSSLVDLFDETSITGKVIKDLFEELFQPLIDGFTGLLPKARTAFIQLEIMVLKALIAIKPYGSKIMLVAKAFGVLALLVGGVVTLATVAFGVSLAMVAAAIGVVLGVIGAMVIATGLLIKMFVDLANTVVNSLVAGFQTVSNFLEGFSLSQVGTDMVSGLAAGIANAGPAVLNAMKGVVTGAVSSAKKLLGIASPSKVFAEIGGYTGEGMAQGVEGSTDTVQGAMETMVAPPIDAAGGGDAAPAAPAASGGGAVFNIEINAGGGDAQSIADAVRGAIQDLLTQAGGGVLNGA
jgi:hypothetical protein